MKKAFSTFVQIIDGWAHFACLEIVQHFNVNLMFLVPLAETLDVFGPAGLDICENVNVFVPNLMLLVPQA